MLESSKPRILIGTGTCGLAAGAAQVLEAIQSELAQNSVDADIINVGCIGLCYAEPLIEIVTPGSAGIFYNNLTPALAADVIRDYMVNGNPRADLAMGSRALDSAGVPPLFDLPVLKLQVRNALRYCGSIDPENIYHYIANGGYSALARVLSGIGPLEVLDEVKKSSLRGRGGGGYPTGAKWASCRNAPAPDGVRYTICNADEGDPGAYMDRGLLEGNPHSVIEGMIIGAYAIGSYDGYIYIRHEYPLATRILRVALDQARECGLLGRDILGSGFDFDLHISQGGGAFVCGESTALMASLEGRIGEPREKHIHTSVSGVYGRPSNLNNVETWANVPLIINNGADWFRRIGTEKSKGTKIFSLVGKVNNTGLVEVPMGITLRQVIFDIGGGIPDGKAFKAVQTGGPSGGCIPESLLDIPVDFDELARVGSMMGSGGMIVMDEGTCMVDVARYFIKFLTEESCGKCVPCREGLDRMLDILDDIAGGKAGTGDIELLEEISEVVKDTSLCALGGTAANPVLSTIRYFRDEYEAHILDRRCPAGVCKALITFKIDPEKCTGCMVCARECPQDAVTGSKKEPHVINEDRCIRCGLCRDLCRFDAVTVS
ncbi:MAG: NADH-quinone oxidoreductase subunit NuoF [Dehalococcoidia bacterium]|nr:NADH-quinone oxidoreductase subunit NuoF [Dehalococcoidia bacterium]